MLTARRAGGPQRRDRITANRAVAYRIHEDVLRGRWYLTASWIIPRPSPCRWRRPARRGWSGVGTGPDHLTAWRLDAHGNPLGAPPRFAFDLSSTAEHRDARVRHALIHLLHIAKRHGLAIAVEDLDFAAEKTREEHGRRKRFRKLISGMPTSRLRAWLVSMAAELPSRRCRPAYTSK